MASKRKQESILDAFRQSKGARELQKPAAEPAKPKEQQQPALGDVHADKRQRVAAAEDSAKRYEEATKKLRDFDLASKYGPCVGVQRLRRWERAEKLGLKPPTDVRDILLSSLATEYPDLKENLWSEDL